MNHLWSPWRMTYIMNSNMDQGCVFCNALHASDGIQNLVIFRALKSFVILNRYPYTSGHLMVVPNAHAGSLGELESDTRAEMMELVSQAIQVLGAVYRPQGFNVGMNLGEVAGAGIAEHVHMHLVPRWGGDTNFMSTTADTRVLPESLEDTYERVSQAWKQFQKG